MKVCSRPGCPVLIPRDAYKGMCDAHRRQHDQNRGTRQQRGYGPAHQAERAAIQARLDAGVTILCARCGQRIQPGSPWHLDHNHQRTGYLGPSHEFCNLSAAGRAAHQPPGGSEAKPTQRANRR